MKPYYIFLNPLSNFFIPSLLFYRLSSFSPPLHLPFCPPSMQPKVLSCSHFFLTSFFFFTNLSLSLAIFVLGRTSLVSSLHTSITFAVALSCSRRCSFSIDFFLCVSFFFCPPLLPPFSLLSLILPRP